MGAGQVNRALLSSFYQNAGDVYDDNKTEGAIGVLADQMDANYVDYATKISTGELSELGLIDAKAAPYLASGLSTSTTGSITTGTALLTVVSTIGRAIGQGISVAGAGVAGATLVTSILAINGLVITLATNASTTVAAATINFDDTVALQAAVAHAISIGKTEVYLPFGTYRYGVLTSTSGITFIGDGVTLIGTTAVTLTSLATLSADVANIAYIISSSAILTDIQNIFTNAPSGSVIRFAKGVNYALNGSLTLGVYKKRIKIEGNGATLTFSNTGDGLNIASISGQYDQNHMIENIKIIGPDPWIPASGYVPVSTGGGINMDYNFSTVIRDVEVNGFNYGVYINTGIKNIFEGRTYLFANQYGLYVGDGVFNANSFHHVKFRENRLHGIHMAGGGVGRATANVFIDCLIESNKPYPFTVSTVPTDSIGVYLSNVYDNIFDNCYFENHAYSHYITGSSDGNKFNNCRTENGSKVAYFSGSSINNTQFNNCVHNSSDFTTPSIESDQEIFLTKVYNCSGFNIIAANLPNTKLDMFNCPPLSSAVGGTIEGSLRIPYYGFGLDPGEGTTRASITGLGTATATLNAEGCGDITFSARVAAASANTTITTFSGLKRGQFLVLFNYQSTRKVTITAGSHSSTSLITLVNDADCILQSYGDMIVFWVNYLGRAVEVSRNVSLTGFSLFDPPSIATGSQSTRTITVSGAVVGDFVQLSYSRDLTGLTLTGYVSAVDTVTAVMFNATGGAVDLLSGYLRCRVTKNNIV